MIIDQAQHVPEPFSYLQTAVDDDDTPGRFALTGSQNLLLIEEARRLYPVEIKSSATVKTSQFEGLQWWNRLTGNPPENSILIHAGTSTRRQHNIAVRPWYAV